MEKTSQTYDPDPIEMQLRGLGNISAEDLQASDLANPTVAKLMLHFQRIGVAQLWATDKALAGQRRLNQELTQKCTRLQVEAARLEKSERYSYIEVLASAVIGYSINLLATEPKSVGSWFYLFCGLAIVLVCKLPWRGRRKGAAPEIEDTHVEEAR